MGEKILSPCAVIRRLSNRAGTSPSPFCIRTANRFEGFQQPLSDVLVEHGFAPGSPIVAACYPHGAHWLRSPTLLHGGQNRELVGVMAADDASGFQVLLADPLRADTDNHMLHHDYPKGYVQ